MFSLHVYGLTFISRGRRGWWFTASDCSSRLPFNVCICETTFFFFFDKGPWTLKIYKRDPTAYFFRRPSNNFKLCGWKELDIFEETRQQFPALWLEKT